MAEPRELLGTGHQPESRMAGLAATSCKSNKDGPFQTLILTGGVRDLGKKNMSCWLSQYLEEMWELVNGGSRTGVAKKVHFLVAFFLFSILTPGAYYTRDLRIQGKLQGMGLHGRKAHRRGSSVSHTKEGRRGEATVTCIWN